MRQSALRMIGAARSEPTSTNLSACAHPANPWSLTVSVASACTIVLGAVPHNKICVTSRATLGFHAAYDFGTSGRTITNREATMLLYSMYPRTVRRWIAARGGLTSQMIFLRGKGLQAMYKPC